MVTFVAGLLILLGAIFTMLAGIGTLRFGDVYARMHPAAKGPTLGLLLVALGAALELRELGPVLALALVVVLQFLAAPLGAHLLGRAIHISLPLQVDEIDELADDLADELAEDLNRDLTHDLTHDLKGSQSSEPPGEGAEP